MSDGMDEIIDDFVTEAEESLEKIDPLFVELESRGYDREILNDIFRSMHTIKGAAGFLGFQSIVDVAHGTEALLKRLREREMEVSTGLISVVLRATDMIKLLLGHIKEKDGVDEDISAMSAELDAALEGGEAEPAAAAPMQPAAHAAPDRPDGQRPVEPPPFVPPADQRPVTPRPAAAPQPRGETRLTPDIPSDEDKQDLIDELFGAAASFGPVDEDDHDHDDEAHIFTHASGEYAVPEEVSPEGTPLPPDVQAAIDAARRQLGAPGRPSPEGRASVASASQPSHAQEQKPAAQEAGRQGAAAQRGALQTLRVDVDRIDKVMNLTGEIVLVRNRLLNISSALEQKIHADEHVEGLSEAVSFLDLVTSDIQLAVMKMRMQPIKKVFGKFPRLVRDISQNLGKDVQLNISGEDTEVDRSVIERIGDPLVHILRNAIDHGIESVEQRNAKGKPAKGLVEVRAYQQGSQIVIEVKDDGRGIDIAKIKGKAMRQGLVSEEEALKMTDKEAINLVFMPGFSTVDIATELSGRGVGMDVVKTNISRLNGYVEIITVAGAGTTLRISIPLTLAIIQALMVRTRGEQYAIPLGPIEETLKISVEDIDYVSGSPVLSIRDRVYPVAELTEMLHLRPSGEASQKKDSRYVLVIAVGDRHFAVGVDELIGQEEVVIKAIDGIDTDATGILGATITGEGKIVLILDPSGMSRMISGMSAVKG